MTTALVADAVRGAALYFGVFSRRFTVGFLDAADYRQEASMAAWLALPHYDAARASLPIYINHVVRNHIASLRIAEARRLHGYRAVPLDSVALAEPAHCFELRLDVARVLAAVSAHDRLVARCLGEHSPATASRELGISRAAVYRAIARLRVAFVAAGYHDSMCCSGRTMDSRHPLEPRIPL